MQRTNGVADRKIGKKIGENCGHISRSTLRYNNITNFRYDVESMYIYFSLVSQRYFFPSLYLPPPLPTFRPRCLGPPVVVPITRYYRSGGTTTTTRPAITYPPRRKRGWRKREKEIQPQGNDIRRGDMPPRYIYLYGLAPSVSDVDNEPRTVVSWGRQR